MVLEAFRTWGDGRGVGAVDPDFGADGGVVDGADVVGEEEGMGTAMLANVLKRILIAFTFDDVFINHMCNQSGSVGSDEMNGMSPHS